MWIGQSVWELFEGARNYRRVDTLNWAISDINEVHGKIFIKYFVCLVSPVPPIASLESSVVVFTF